MDNTKTKILAATERLIMEYGWEKVTFRMITSEAGVNLAAINYHFGSREALEDALLPRLIGPLDEKQLQALKKARMKAAPDTPDLESIVRCFLESMLEFSREYPNHHRMIQGFFSGIKNKEKIKEHFKDNIDRVNQEFVETLFKALPGASREKILVQYVLFFESSHIFLNNDAFKGITESLGLSITIDAFLEEMILLFCAAFRMLQNNAQ
jgi:AcrR family transcriptional regulator